MTRTDRTFYRDTEDRKIGGVCSGLARYFDVDPVLVRVAFVAALVFGGGSLVAYLLLWWFVDEAPAGMWDQDVATPTVEDQPAADDSDADDIEQGVDADAAVEE